MAKPPSKNDVRLALWSAIARTMVMMIIIVVVILVLVWYVHKL